MTVTSNDGAPTFSPCKLDGQCKGHLQAESHQWDGSDLQDWCSRGPIQLWGGRGGGLAAFRCVEGRSGLAQSGHAWAQGQGRGVNKAAQAQACSGYMAKAQAGLDPLLLTAKCPASWGSPQAGCYVSSG